MLIMEQQDIYESRAFMFLMMITIFRLVYGVGLNAMPDEADYFVWSERLDLSYYCHPPMLMYFLAAAHQFVHSKTLVLRLVTVGLTAGASIYIFHLAVALFNDARRAFHCVALANLTLLFMAGSLLATPDSPMIFFLCGAMYHFYLAVKFGEKKHWLLAGMMTGFALLSKFVAFLVYPSFLLYLLLKEHRKWLASAMPYLAFAVSLLMFSPVMYWNSQHGWTNFAFQLQHGFSQSDPSKRFPRWNKFFEFLGAQAGLIGPILFVMFIAALLAVVLRWKKTPMEEKFLACFASVPLLFFLGASLQKKMEANWACFAYAPGILLALAFYERVLRPKRWARVLWKIHWGYSVIVLALLFAHIYAPFLPIRKDRTNEFFGWKAFGEEARALAARHPGFELAANRYQIASELIFYSNMWATCFNIEGRPNQYDIWQEQATLRGKNYLFFDDGSAPKDAVKNSFERFEWLATIPLKRGERTVREIRVYQAYNFRRNW